MKKTLKNLRENWKKKKEAKQAAKHDKGKLRYDLLPPEALEEIVKVFTFGADKYADRNWEKGQPWGKPFGAIMRHCWSWWGGEKNDSETGLSHLAHAGAEILFLLTYSMRKVGVDDSKEEKQYLNGFIFKGDTEEGL